MAQRFVHWRYLGAEATHRWKRTVLTVAGIAMAVALVVLLDVLGRAFADISVLPFKNLSSDLIVQRSATKSSMPEQMGLMLPYSAQVITADELSRLKDEKGVSEVGGFVLLWNLGSGRFFSISGLSFDESAAKLGPAKVREWLF
jgi:ABC-type antimicrobial peptide transport system permease subunit